MLLIGKPSINRPWLPWLCQITRWYIYGQAPHEPVVLPEVEQAVARQPRTALRR